GDRHHAGDGQQARHVLAVVDLVEEPLLGGVDVHGGAEEVAGVDGHGVAPCLGRGGLVVVRVGAARCGLLLLASLLIRSARLRLRLAKPLQWSTVSWSWGWPLPRRAC